jgi:hypothetical protein
VITVADLLQIAREAGLVVREDGHGRTFVWVAQTEDVATERPPFALTKGEIGRLLIIEGETVSGWIPGAGRVWGVIDAAQILTALRRLVGPTDEDVSIVTAPAIG